MDRRDLLLFAGGSLSAGLAGCFEQVQRREGEEIPTDNSTQEGGDSGGNGGSSADGSGDGSGGSDSKAGSEGDSVDDGTAGGDGDDGSNTDDDSTDDGTGTDDSSDDGTDDSTGEDGDGTDDSSSDDGDGTDDSTDDGTDDGSDGTDDGSDDGSDDSTDDGSDDDTDDGTDDGSDDDTDDGTDDDGDDGDGDDGDDGTDGTTELPDSFKGVGIDGFLWTGEPDEADARNGDIEFLPPSEVDPPIAIEGDVDVDSGSWESTTVFFPVLPVDSGVEVKITAPNGLYGQIDFDSDFLTLEGELHVDFVDIDASFTMTILAVTGDSGALTGGLILDDDTGTALLVDNEYIVDEESGNNIIDNEMNLPSTVSGDNWFELQLDLDLIYD